MASYMIRPQPRHLKQPAHHGQHGRDCKICVRVNAEAFAAFLAPDATNRLVATERRPELDATAALLLARYEAGEITLREFSSLWMRARAEVA